MARRKKLEFKLNPEWMLKEPIDFEYNKYTLLDYLQKCEKNFDKLEIYPDFVELSLHLANLQSIVKENTLLLTDKKFKSCDDEILLKELYSKKMRDLTKEEEDELNKTIKFSGNKLFDAFNLGKSIWNMAYDSLQITLKKNKSNIDSGSGYVYYYSKFKEKLLVWEYEIKKVKGDEVNSQTELKLIYEGDPKELTLLKILETFSKWNKTEKYSHLPVFEIQSTQNFPIESTLIPMIKRKIMAYVYQIVNIEKIKNFDSQE
jgi:hypothetical protein